MADKVIFTLTFESEPPDRHQVELIESELEQVKNEVLFSLRQQAGAVYGSLTKEYPQPLTEDDLKWKHLHGVLTEARESGINPDLIHTKLTTSEPIPHAEPVLVSTATPEQIKEKMSVPRKEAPRAKRTPGRAAKNNKAL